MAIAIVGTPSHTNSFAATNPTLTVQSTSSGSLLIALIGEGQNTTSVTGVADNAGNTYTHLTAADAHDTFSMFSSIWYCANANSGGTTLTFTGSNVTAAMFSYEFSGAATSTPADTTGILQNQTTANPESGATVTPTNSGDVCVSIISSQDASGATGVSASWTGFVSDAEGGKACCTAYIIPSSTSAQTPSFTGHTGGGSEYCSSSASFLPATSATFVISHMEAGQMSEVGTVM